MEIAEQARGLQDYVGALEEERRKIQVFQRELPLSLQLLTQAIESIKEHMSVEEATPSEPPVLEEFLPLRPSCSSSEEDEGPRRHLGEEPEEKKPDWLRSVQLWNQDPEPLHRSDPPLKPVPVAAMRGGGAFHPFVREKHGAPQALAVAAASSSAETTTTGGGGNKRGCDDKEKEGQSQPHRKARRCWSAELHRRFIHALQHLGGSNAATPKQIRELMKVDGLTNDEVKSHLQKYRLHTKRPRPGPAVQSSSCSSPQAPQFLVVGSLWVPPPEYAAAATPPTEATAAPLNEIYAPVASVPSLKNKKLAGRSSTGPLHPKGISDREVDADGAANSASPTTSSSSSQTTTASPHF